MDNPETLDQRIERITQQVARMVVIRHNELIEKSKREYHEEQYGVAGTIAEYAEALTQQHAWALATRHIETFRKEGLSDIQCLVRTASKLLGDRDHGGATTGRRSILEPSVKEYQRSAIKSVVGALLYWTSFY